MTEVENWRQVAEWVLTQLYDLRQPSVPVEPEATAYINLWIEKVSGYEKSATPQVDAAAQAIAAGNALPELTATEKCFLALRVSFAEGLSQALAEAEEPSSNSISPVFGAGFSTYEKRRYLLVEAWHSLGRHLWISQSYWLDDWQCHSANFRPQDQEGLNE